MSAAIGVGALGTGFHLYNVTKRVGGFRWENFFYGAPLGAPAALALSGMAGLAADRLAGNAKRSGEATLLGLPAGRVARGLDQPRPARHGRRGRAAAFPRQLPEPRHVPAGDAAAGRRRRDGGGGARARRAASDGWRETGSASPPSSASRAWRFHCYGVSRAMGGWRNWRQNVIDGPPIPAPPSFAGLALGGLAALTLIERAER